MSTTRPPHRPSRRYMTGLYTANTLLLAIKDARRDVDDQDEEVAVAAADWLLEMQSRLDWHLRRRTRCE